MNDLAIVIGESPAAVIAIAAARRIAIRNEDIQAFSSLTTVYSPGFPVCGRIDADRQGYVVIGVMQ